MIEVLAVVDTDGQQWSRMPEAWSANAALCSASEEYEMPGGDAYIVWCMRPSVWCYGEQGFCGFHFESRLEFGDVKAARTGQSSGGFLVSGPTRNSPKPVRRLAEA